jgi:hypothetical protein
VSHAVHVLYGTVRIWNRTVLHDEPSWRAIPSILKAHMAHPSAYVLGGHVQQPTQGRGGGSDVGSTRWRLPLKRFVLVPLRSREASSTTPQCGLDLASGQCSGQIMRAESDDAATLFSNKDVERPASGHYSPRSADYPFNWSGSASYRRCSATSYHGYLQ